VPVVEVEGLEKRYGGTRAVEDVTFSVEEGEIFGLLGPNGAGKTTSVECVQGLRRRDGGRVRVLGLDPQERPDELRRRIGSQLQESALPDRIRVWEALDLFASFAPQAGDWELLLDAWGLRGLRRASFAGLSGGQRQRLFVALALVNDPEIVFLDELTQGLDPAARRVAWGLIRAVRERGATVVMVTHFMDEAEHLCDRLAVVDRGRVVALDTTTGIVERAGFATRVLFTAEAGNLDWLDGVPGVQRVTRSGPRVEVEGSGAVLVHVAAGLLEHGLAPDDLRLERPTLEDAFLALTGHAAAEDERSGRSRS
jgi:ABC-2 type transport system ATP-binding protein